MAIRPHSVNFSYRPETFALGEPFTHFTDELTKYWKQESPALQDFPSIVSLQHSTSRHNAQTSAAKVSLECRPTTYFQFLLSNYSLDTKVLGGELFRNLLDRHMTLDPQVTDEAYNTNTSSWENYSFPPMGNSVGITISVITADNHVVIAKRSQSCTSIARDKGNCLCAVGTQIKRHQPRFLDEGGMPSPAISVREGLRDEMGSVISDSCPVIECLGMVYRGDFCHAELLYETTSSLTWEALNEVWQSTGIPDKREFESIAAIAIETPHAILEHLTQNRWSPQHAAGVYHSLLRRFPNQIDHCGFSV